MVFLQGLARHSTRPIGTWTISVGAIVLLLRLPLPQRQGLGTLNNVLVIGLVVNVVLEPVPVPRSPAVEYIALIYLIMYEFFVLGALSRVPMHGYLIAKVLGNIIGPFRHLQWGALYPVLSRLQAEGFVAAEESADDEDVHARKVYSITDKGRARLHEHLMDTESHIGTYDAVFPHKVSHYSTLTPEERLHLSRHYAVHAQENLDHLERKLKDLAENPRLSHTQRDDISAVMHHRIEHWNHERAWAEILIETRAVGQTETI